MERGVRERGVRERGLKEDKRDWKTGESRERVKPRETGETVEVRKIKGD